MVSGIELATLQSLGLFLNHTTIGQRNFLLLRLCRMATRNQYQHTFNVQLHPRTNNMKKPMNPSKCPVDSSQWGFFTIYHYFWITLTHSIALYCFLLWNLKSLLFCMGSSEWNQLVFQMEHFHHSVRHIFIISMHVYGACDGLASSGVHGVNGVQWGSWGTHGVKRKVGTKTWFEYRRHQWKLAEDEKILYHAIVALTYKRS